MRRVSKTVNYLKVFSRRSTFSPIVYLKKIMSNCSTTIALYLVHLTAIVNSQTRGVKRKARISPAKAPIFLGVFYNFALL